MDKKAEKETKDLSDKVLLDACLYSFCRLLREQKLPPMSLDDFRNRLSETMASVPPPPKGMSPISQLLPMMEDFIKGVSRIIVAASAVIPETLEEIMNIPEDQVKLLRRGMEEHLIELATSLLKSHVLNDHVSYNEFVPTSRKNKQ